MAIYQGDTKISGNAKVSSFPLFTTQWQDHITNDASWVRSETFSWQSGTVYVSAYNHLVDDIDAITSETETVAGTTITFKRAADGHKIVDDTQVSNVEAIYNATGVAWYYVLDTTNQRFKLPRSQWNFVGLRDNVGNYVPESLPNITGTVGRTFAAENSGAFYTVNVTSSAQGGSGGGVLHGFDASRSSATYQNGAPVQQRATQMYLYFYVGNTVQNETSVDVAELAEDLNGKADIDLGNLSNAGKIVGSGLGMPSDTYDALTLGASGTTYTAPANGYYYVNAVSYDGNPAHFVFINNTKSFVVQNQVYSSYGSIVLLMPVTKNDTVEIQYGNIGTAIFRFYYAEGSKS